MKLACCLPYSVVFSSSAVLLFCGSSQRLHVLVADVGRLPEDLPAEPEAMLPALLRGLGAKTTEPEATKSERDGISRRDKQPHSDMPIIVLLGWILGSQRSAQGRQMSAHVVSPARTPEYSGEWDLERPKPRTNSSRNGIHVTSRPV